MLAKQSRYYKRYAHAMFYSGDDVRAGADVDRMRVCFARRSWDGNWIFRFEIRTRGLKGVSVSLVVVRRSIAFREHAIMKKKKKFTRNDGIGVESDRESDECKYTYGFNHWSIIPQKRVVIAAQSNGSYSPDKRGNFPAAKNRIYINDASLSFG